MSQCILLNADYSFMNMVDWRRAMRLVVKNKVTVLRYSERCIKGAEGLLVRIPNRRTSELYTPEPEVSGIQGLKVNGKPVKAKSENGYAVEARNEAGALCMVVRSKGSTPRHTGSKMLVYPDGSIVGTVGGGELENRVIAEARQAILDGQSRLLEYDLSDPARGDPGVCGGQVEVFVEPVLPKPTLIVIGAGHVGRAVVHLAKWLGFRVVVNDDRAEFCTPEATPEARLC